MSNPNVIGDTGTTYEGCVDAMYYFAVAVAAGDTVMEDVGTTTTSNGNTIPAGGAAKKSTATDDLASILGGALYAVRAGTFGMVRRAGVQTGVACGTVTAGDPLMSSTSAAGRVAIASASSVNIVANALTSASSNTCTVRWKTL